MNHQEFPSQTFRILIIYIELATGQIRMKYETVTREDFQKLVDLTWNDPISCLSYASILFLGLPKSLLHSLQNKQGKSHHKRLASCGIESPASFSRISTAQMLQCIYNSHSPPDEGV